MSDEVAAGADGSGLAVTGPNVLGLLVLMTLALSAGVAAIVVERRHRSTRS